MAKSKGNRVQVILECTEHKDSGQPGPSRYITTINWIMAKKVVASLQKGGGKAHTKVIKMVKSDKSGSYSFKEEIVHNTKVQEWFNKS